MLSANGRKCSELAVDGEDVVDASTYLPTIFDSANFLCPNHLPRSLLLSLSCGSAYEKAGYCCCGYLLLHSRALKAPCGDFISCNPNVLYDVGFLLLFYSTYYSYICFLLSYLIFQLFLYVGGAHLPIH